MIFAEHVKNKLSSLIHEMATAPWVFSKNPEVDFSRNRKLDFVSTIQFLLSMESGSLKKNCWIISSSLSIPRLLQRSVNRETNYSWRHSSFRFMNLILVSHLKKSIRIISY